MSFGSSALAGRTTAPIRASLSSNSHSKYRKGRPHRRHALIHLQGVGALRARRTTAAFRTDRAHEAAARQAGFLVGHQLDLEVLHLGRHDRGRFDVCLRWFEFRLVRFDG
jgi:hypothetical protein